MINKVIFYTIGHNGDIHYSREFVKDIIKYFANIPIEYHYNGFKKLLKDIHLEVKPFDLWDIQRKNFYYDPKLKIFYINTWIGCDYSNDGSGRYGCCLKSNYAMYKKIFDLFHLNIKEEKDYIPEIDWKSYDIKNIDEFFKNNKYSCYCLISNGKVLSGQAHNLNLNEIISQLASNFKNTAFVLTDSFERIDGTNIFYTDDIIKATDGDLNEIGYLSTKCNIIIGRASGPFCFCHNKTNLYDKSKTFIVFSNNKSEGMWAEMNELETAKQIWSNNFDFKSIYDIIYKQIGKFYGQ